MPNFKDVKVPAGVTSAKLVLTSRHTLPGTLRARSGTARQDKERDACCDRRSSRRRDEL